MVYEKCPHVKISVDGSVEDIHVLYLLEYRSGKWKQKGKNRKRRECTCVPHERLHSI